MVEKPQFYIIAGPNGAGKSTFGDLLLPHDTPIFNGDLVMADLVKRYPHIEPIRLGGGVALQLEKDRDAAILVAKNFGFESNYSNQMAIDITQLFKDNGYKTNLIYFGLDNIEDSVSRIETRILRGGHNVSPDVVIFNREEGIRRVKENLDLYDSIRFVDTGQFSPVTVAVYREQTNNLTNNSDQVKWFNEHFRDRLKKLVYRKQVDWEIPSGKAII